jgi:transposase-like protein
MRDLEEFMAERGLSIDHTTIWRRRQVYGPEVYGQLRGNVKRKSSTWHVDETFVRIASRWLVLVSCGRQQQPDRGLLTIGDAWTRDREAAKIFLQTRSQNPDNRRFRVLAQDGPRS